MLGNKIGNINKLIMFTVLFYIYEFYNFVILSGLLLFVFGVDNEVAFRRGSRGEMWGMHLLHLPFSNMF